MYRQPPGALRALETCVTKVFCVCVRVCVRCRCCCDLQFAVMHKNTHQPQFTLTFSLYADERKMMGIFFSEGYEKRSTQSIYEYFPACLMPFSVLNLEE